MFLCLHRLGFMLYNSLLSITVKCRSIMVKTPSDTFEDIYLGYTMCDKPIASKFLVWFRVCHMLHAAM